MSTLKTITRKTALDQAGELNRGDIIQLLENYQTLV